MARYMLGKMASNMIHACSNVVTCKMFLKYH